MHIKRNCKIWRKSVNLRNNNVCLLNPMIYNGTVGSNDSDIVDLYAKHFRSVYNNDIATLNNINVKTNKSLDVFTLTFDQVSFELRNLKTSLSSWPDGMNSTFINKLWHLLAEPLLYFFNTSIESGYFPSLWGKPFIPPSYKRSAEDNINNYRPITKSSLFFKVFDLLILKN